MFQELNIHCKGNRFDLFPLIREIIFNVIIPEKAKHAASHASGNDHKA